MLLTVAACMAEPACDRLTAKSEVLSRLPILRFKGEHPEWDAYLHATYLSDPDSRAYPIDLRTFGWLYTAELPESFEVEAARLAVACKPAYGHAWTGHETCRDVSVSARWGQQHLPEGNLFAFGAFVQHEVEHRGAGQHRVAHQFAVDNSWIEVLRTTTAHYLESCAPWYFVATGSGLWINVGRTFITEHGDQTDYLPAASRCAGNEHWRALLASGYDTVQFGVQRGMDNARFELIDLRHWRTRGHETRRSFPACVAGTVYRAGWHAMHQCNCSTLEADPAVTQAQGLVASCRSHIQSVRSTFCERESEQTGPSKRVMTSPSKPSGSNSRAGSTLCEIASSGKSSVHSTEVCCEGAGCQAVTPRPVAPYSCPLPAYGCQVCYVCNASGLQVAVITNPKAGSTQVRVALQAICPGANATGLLTLWDGSCESFLVNHAHEFVVLTVFRADPVHRFLSGYTEMLWRLWHRKKLPGSIRLPNFQGASDWVHRFAPLTMPAEHVDHLHSLLLNASDASMGSWTSLNKKAAVNQYAYSHTNLHFFEEFVKLTERAHLAHPYNEHLKAQTMGIPALRFSRFLVPMNALATAFPDALRRAGIRLSEDEQATFARVLHSTAYFGHPLHPLFSASLLRPATVARICEITRDDDLACCMPPSALPAIPCPRPRVGSEGCRCQWLPELKPEHKVHHDHHTRVAV